MVTTDRAELAARLTLDGARVVDVGSGEGGLVRWLRGQGADAIGVECGQVMLERAHAADPNHRDAHVEGVGQDLPLDDASMDIVIFSYSLHHVPAGEMVNALREAHRVLRPGGALYVMEPVPAGPGFSVVRVIDDETEVRRQAQDALTQAVSLGLQQEENSTYSIVSTHTDFEAWEHTVVGIDPGRAALLDANRELVAQLFEEHGVRTEDGYAFAQDINVQVFVKP